MIDLKALRADPETFRNSQLARGEDPGIVDALLVADSTHRAQLAEFERLRAEQKALSKDVGRLQRAVREPAATDATRAELDEVMAATASLAAAVKSSESAAKEAGGEVAALAGSLSNVVSPESPVGGEEDFRVLDTVGAPRDFAAEGFQPRDHVELGELLGAIDVERAAKVSGSRFFYLTGPGALLELALLNLAVSMATGNGFTPVIPPALVKPEAMEGTGFLGQAAENVYHLADDDMYLVGTAEVPLAALHSQEIISPADLPLRYVGFSPCFRREAGSHGRDTRGIIRVHQFDKVEMFSYVTPDESADEHTRLLGWEREFVDALEIPYRVIDVATGDLGASAARKFDIEAWIPTQGRYREITSTSDCTGFQARRLGIRTRDAEGRPVPLATLNGTLCAMPRVIVAILENHQRPDGSVVLPAALRPFFGREVIVAPGS
ncbi:MAG: serine--tRNA ligase [Actinobacteria bacterium]|nr:serine--tRNA ligase [Actinomycetota bacterium]